MPTSIRVIMVIIAIGLIIFSLSMGVHNRNATSENVIEPIVIVTSTPAPTEDPDPEETFWDSEKHWLAMALQLESGPNWDRWQIVMIGDVIMHRVRNPEYPNTIKEVLLDEGQYEPFFPPFEPFMPEKKYIDIAEAIIEDGESYLSDPRIVYQALFEQGAKTVFSIYDEDLGTRTYFCRD